MGKWDTVISKSPELFKLNPAVTCSEPEGCYLIRIIEIK